jgi:hypothetical protein
MDSNKIRHGVEPLGDLPQMANPVVKTTRGRRRSHGFFKTDIFFVGLLGIGIFTSGWASSGSAQFHVDPGHSQVLFNAYSIATPPHVEVYQNYCADLQRARVLFANNLPYKNLSSLDLAKASLNYFLSSPDAQGRSNLWNTGLYPFKLSQNLTLTFLLHQLGEFGVRLKNLNELRDSLKQPEAAIGKNEISEFLQRAGQLPVNNRLYTQQVTDDYLIRAACAQYDLRSANECTRATKMIIEEVNLKPTNGSEGANRMYPHLWSKLFTDVIYQDGIRLAALAIWDRVSGSLSTTDSIFSDLLSSFQAAGMDSEASMTATFEALAVISNNSQNILPRVMGTPLVRNRQTLLSLSFISVAISYLDFIKYEKLGSLYSLPAGKIQSDCLNTKWYHFWSSAYLSRHLVKGGVRPLPAVYATYNAAKGYQTNRRVGDDAKKDKLGRILMMSDMNPTHQVIRIDLTLAAAGAFFGAFGSHPKFQLNIDEGLDVLISNAGSSEPLLLDDVLSLLSDRMHAYNKWNRIFAPNSAIDQYAQRTGVLINSNP